MKPIDSESTSNLAATQSTPPSSPTLDVASESTSKPASSESTMPPSTHALVPDATAKPDVTPSTLPPKTTKNRRSKANRSKPKSSVPSTVTGGAGQDDDLTPLQTQPTSTSQLPVTGGAGRDEDSRDVRAVSDRVTGSLAFVEKVVLRGNYFGNPDDLESRLKQYSGKRNDQLAAAIDHYRGTMQIKPLLACLLSVSKTLDSDKPAFRDAQLNGWTFVAQRWTPDIELAFSLVYERLTTLLKYKSLDAGMKSELTSFKQKIVVEYEPAYVFQFRANPGLNTDKLNFDVEDCRRAEAILHEKLEHDVRLMKFEFNYDATYVRKAISKPLLTTRDVLLVYSETLEWVCHAVENDLLSKIVEKIKTLLPASIYDPFLEFIFHERGNRPAMTALDAFIKKSKALARFATDLHFELEWNNTMIGEISELFEHYPDHLGIQIMFAKACYYSGQFTQSINMFTLAIQNAKSAGIPQLGVQLKSFVSFSKFCAFPIEPMDITQFFIFQKKRMHYLFIADTEHFYHHVYVKTIRELTEPGLLPDALTGIRDAFFKQLSEFQTDDGRISKTVLTWTFALAISEQYLDVAKEWLLFNEAKLNHSPFYTILQAYLDILSHNEESAKSRLDALDQRRPYLKDSIRLKRWLNGPRNTDVPKPSSPLSYLENCYVANNTYTQAMYSPGLEASMARLKFLEDFYMGSSETEFFPYDRLTYNAKDMLSLILRHIHSVFDLEELARIYLIIDHSLISTGKPPLSLDDVFNKEKFFVKESKRMIIIELVESLILLDEKIPIDPIFEMRQLMSISFLMAVDRPIARYHDVVGSISDRYRTINPDSDPVLVLNKRLIARLNSLLSAASEAI